MSLIGWKFQQRWQDSFGLYQFHCVRLVRFYLTPDTFFSYSRIYSVGCIVEEAVRIRNNGKLQTLRKCLLPQDFRDIGEKMRKASLAVLKKSSSSKTKIATKIKVADVPPPPKRLRRL